MFGHLLCNGKAALHRGRRRGRSKHAKTTCWSEGGPRATLATRNGASTTKRRTTETTERNANGTTQQTHTDTHTDTPANATKTNTHTHTHTHKAQTHHTRASCRSISAKARAQIHGGTPLGSTKLTQTLRQNTGQQQRHPTQKRKHQTEERHRPAK